jgi:hypothetical protein
MKNEHHCFRAILSSVALLTAALALPASAGCMQRAKASTSGFVAKSVLVVPRAKQSYYEARGFSPVGCPKDLSVMRTWTERLCSAVEQPRSGRPIDTVALLGMERPQACEEMRLGLREQGG